MTAQQGPDTLPAKYRNYAVVTVIGPHGGPVKATASREDIDSGETSRWFTGGSEVCPIVSVESSPLCDRCHRPLDPDTTFDAGTGHWEMCRCLSWRDRALTAESHLAVHCASGHISESCYRDGE